MRRDQRGTKAGALPLIVALLAVSRVIVPVRPVPAMHEEMHADANSEQQQRLRRDTRPSPLQHCTAAPNYVRSSWPNT
jgi:hypothetical protein